MNEQRFTTGLDPACEAYLQEFGLRTPHSTLARCHFETAAHDQCASQIPHHQGEW
jgi:hypothetical protein